jgi:hypothetical protein
MHLIPGLQASAPTSLVQATRTTCAPILGLALHAPARYGSGWAESCIRFNYDVFHALQTSLRSTEVVVLSSLWLYLVGNDLMSTNGDVVHSTMAQLEDGIVATVQAVRASGKRVVIVAPPPLGGFDVGRCIERREAHKLAFGGTADCSIPYDVHVATSAVLRELLGTVARRADVDVVDFEATLCDQARNRCMTQVDGTYIYLDGGHLSIEGSRWLGRRRGLAAELWRRAR